MNELQSFAAAPKIHYYASKSRELGKLAASVSGDQAASALHEKAAADASLYNLIEKVANNLIENLKTLKNPIVKGLAMGAGLAVPGVIAGKYLINDAEESAKDVIYPALGAAGIGAGLYGLSQMFGGSDNGSAPGKRASEDLIKQGSAAFLVAADLVKVAQETEDPELRKLANETLQVALAHVADVVGDLIL